VKHGTGLGQQFANNHHLCIKKDLKRNRYLSDILMMFVSIALFLLNSVFVAE